MLQTWLLAACTLTGGPSLDDAGLPESPQSTEHRALVRQVELMRLETLRDRTWHERQRAERLKADLVELEKLLDEVELIYAERLAACQQHWHRLSPIKDPAVGAHPAYYACAGTVWVSDGMVRALRRRADVRRRLAARHLASDDRVMLQQEAMELDRQVDRAAGIEPLAFQAPGPHTGVDAGALDVPEDPGLMRTR
jgi:hypothetical protein